MERCACMHRCKGYAVHERQDAPLHALASLAGPLAGRDMGAGACDVVLSHMWPPCAPSLLPHAAQPRQLTPRRATLYQHMCQATTLPNTSLHSPTASGTALPCYNMLLPCYNMLLPCYNTPAHATTHQHMLQHTSTCYNTPAHATTHHATTHQHTATATASPPPERQHRVRLVHLGSDVHLVQQPQALQHLPQAALVQLVAVQPQAGRGWVCSRGAGQQGSVSEWQRWIARASGQAGSWAAAAGGGCATRRMWYGRCCQGTIRPGRGRRSLTSQQVMLLCFTSCQRCLGAWAHLRTCAACAAPPPPPHQSHTARPC
jgi:hypothetical protein